MPKITVEPEIAARTALKEYAEQFGIRDPFKDLQLRIAKKSPNGDHTIKFWQVQEGIRVYGAELVVGMDDFGRIFTINGEISPAPPINFTPALSPQQAREAALTDAAQKHSVARETIETEEPQLYVYNPALFDKGENQNLLVWGANLHSIDSGPFARFVLVDAKDGSVRLDVTSVDDILSRQIYDSAGSYVENLPGTNMVRWEYKLPVGIPDVDDAYDYSGAAYDYYLQRHGRDSYNGGGYSVISTVRQGSPSGGLWDNAGWAVFNRDKPNETGQMVFGEGYIADDVVGHEFTHGVTRFESKLESIKESWAIKESLADIWGEFIDIDYVNGDLPADMWLMGEDLPNGPLRDMSNPERHPFYDPAKVTSPLYDCGEDDDGHKNCGVNNHAVYLMFNPPPPLRIPRNKIAKIYYYAATEKLTRLSNYYDLYEYLLYSCDYLASGLGLTPIQIDAFKQSLDAVEMYKIPCVSPKINIVGAAGKEINVSPLDNVTITSELDVMSSYQNGKPADWWVGAIINGVYYYLDSSFNWTTQPTPTAQGPLGDVAPYEVYSGTLPVGQTIFVFLVDLNTDGSLSYPQRHDAVTVNIQ